MRFPDPFLYQQLGLTRLRTFRRSERVGERRTTLSESRMRENRPRGFDEREVETEHAQAREAPATERAGNR